ncbi:MAG: GDSL-type esterase/lipase family protein [Bryobacteraceae bacterium]|nr:GDSL-type esterase/lipase family protein [Bryobacteraceae bacterium]
MPTKTLLTLACFALFLKIPDWLPAFRDYKVLDWSGIPAVFDFVPKNSMAQEQAILRPEAERVAALSAGSILGPLDRFYDALAELETKPERGGGRVVRVLHYGDSPTTADMITADVRALLQKRFGSAGHGYHLIAKPWAWYEHRGVSVSADGWRITPATQGSERDGQYGLGGVSFRGGAGAWARFRLSEPHRIAEVDQPEGGSLQATRASEAAWEVRTSGETRVFGVSFLTGEPGIVYHSLGLNGASITVMSKSFNYDRWSAVMRRAQPDLVVINYGTNESVYAQFVDTAFEKELREAVRRVRAAVPEASILLMSPMDRGQRNSDGEIVTVPALHRLVTIEQRVAADLGVGFFSTFDAMGGPGTMGRWYQAEPRLVGADFIHPSPGGAKIVGHLLYKAIMGGYQRYKTKRLTEKFAPK